MAAAAQAMAVYRADAVFSFIPKNGCTTMCLSIALANGCIASPAEIHRVHQNNATFAATLGELERVRSSRSRGRRPERARDSGS